MFEETIPPKNDDVIYEQPLTQVKFRPRLEPEKQRALASFHIMNSVKVSMMVIMVMLTMTMMTNNNDLTLIAAFCLFACFQHKSYGPKYSLSLPGGLGLVVIMVMIDNN